MKAQEVEESTRIDKRSNFQDFNACKLYLMSQRFLEKESLKQDIESRPIYKKIIFMHMGPIVKEKYMQIGVNISLSYWLMGRSPLIEFLYLNLEDKNHIQGRWNVMTQIKLKEDKCGG